MTSRLFMSHAPASAVDGIWIAAHHEEDTVRCRSNVHISWARPLLGFFEQGHFVRQLRASDLHLRHSPKLECGPPCLSLNVLVLVPVVVAMAWVHKAAARAGSVYGRLPQTRCSTIWRELSRIIIFQVHPLVKYI